MQAELPLDTALRNDSLYEFLDDSTQREETWPYDTDGSVVDVKVYDYEYGLQAGNYRLELLLNGEPQLTGTFSIEEPPAVGPVTVAGQTAVAQEDQLQITGDTINQTWTTNGPVTSMEWMPDGNALLFAVRRVAHLERPLNLQGGHELWLLELETGQQRQLAQMDEDLHQPSVSPNGRFVVLNKGIGFGDACFVDTALYIMELDAENRRVGLTEATGYSGVPTAQNDIYFHTYEQFANNRFNESNYPGTWTDDNTLQINFFYTCMVENTPSGVYALDVVAETAVFVEPFPTTN